MAQVVTSRCDQHGKDDKEAIMSDDLFVREPCSVKPFSTVVSPPATLFGSECVWPSDYRSPLVFMFSFSVGSTAYHLYAARFEISLDRNTKNGRGFVVEYFVLDEKGEALVARITNEFKGICLASADLGHQRSRSIDAEEFSVDQPPRWEARSEAFWPTFEGKPLGFIRQISIPPKEPLRDLLQVDWTVYLLQHSKTARHLQSLSRRSVVRVQNSMTGKSQDVD